MPSKIRPFFIPNLITFTCTPDSQDIGSQPPPTKTSRQQSSLLPRRTRALGGRGVAGGKCSSAPTTVRTSAKLRLTSHGRSGRPCGHGTMQRVSSRLKQTVAEFEVKLTSPPCRTSPVLSPFSKLVRDVHAWHG